MLLIFGDFLRLLGVLLLRLVELLAIVLHLFNLFDREVFELKLSARIKELAQRLKRLVDSFVDFGEYLHDFSRLFLAKAGGLQLQDLQRRLLAIVPQLILTFFNFGPFLRVGDQAVFEVVGQVEHDLRELLVKLEGQLVHLRIALHDKLLPV